MDAILHQRTEYDQHPFAPEQQGLRDFGSSTTNSREPSARPAQSFSWPHPDFDRPCPVSSPLNEW
jgi:hypothetical protein